MAEAKVSMEIPWQEGSEDDFEDLRKAIQESKAQKYENKTKEEIMDEDAFATNYGLVEEDLPEPPKVTTKLGFVCLFRRLILSINVN